MLATSISWGIQSVAWHTWPGWKAITTRPSFYVSRSLRLNQSIGDSRAVLACLAKFAAIAASRGELPKAASLAAVVERECAETGLRLMFMDRNEFDLTLARLRGEMDPRIFQHAYTAGAALPLGAALDLALQETQPGPGSTQNSRKNHAG